MALPLPRESAPEPPSSDLPATYRNPWQTLGENLQAVVADARLRARELWRRNGQGTLWRPSWWPADLAPLFWPLLLAAALALTSALFSAGWMAFRSRPAVPASEPPDPLSNRSAEVAEAPSLATPAGSTPGDNAPAPTPVAPAPSPEPALAEPVPEPDVSHPLEALLQWPDAEGVLIGASVLPDQVSLVLELAPAFANLPAPERQRRAEQWQQRAADLGYDHLELRDSRSGLLARDALVGSGMIVLSEPPRP